MRRLLLVRHAPTGAVRRVAFPCDEGLDERARAQAAALAGWLGDLDEAFTGREARARETAAAAGLAAVVEPALDECDFGGWRGRTLRELHESDPAAVAEWMTNPHSAPHGGESIAALAARVGRWLDGQAPCDGSAAAITHSGPVKAAVAHALGAPLVAFWRIDVAPLAITELHAHDGRWTVARLNWRPATRRARPRAAAAVVEAGSA
jgi:broad specificity phosphatase PhoE